jgi:hypothetical protein
MNRPVVDVVDVGNERVVMGCGQKATVVDKERTEQSKVLILILM